MTRSLICLTLALSTALGGALRADPSAPVPTQPPAVETAAPAPEEVPAPVPDQPLVYVNGQSVDVRAAAEDGVTYVSVCLATQALCPDATVAWESDHVALTGTGFSMTVQPGASYLVCNGRYLYIPGQIRTHTESGDLLVPIRVLAKALGAQVDWDPSGTYLTPGTPLESGDTFYNAQDLDLIARVVQHESGNQPLAGKIGVANVILNRVKFPQFPNTVSGVLNQKNQFPGATNATPKAQAIIAAKLAMDGPTPWATPAGSTGWASPAGPPKTRP